MATNILFEERIAVPGWIENLADFRRWALSDVFPDTGRIDYLAGEIEVDMCPEDLLCHGSPKGEIYAALHRIVRDDDLGHLFIDSTRVSSISGDLSVEPDIVFVSWMSLESGHVRMVPKAGEAENRFVEIEGAPDLVVEIVSDSSVNKDTKRLPMRYFAAGVKEFWLVDARRADLTFQIHHRGEDRFEPAAFDSDGFQASHVFANRFRFSRHAGRMGHWQYDLQPGDDR